MKKYDFAIIGGGIVGLTIADSLLKKNKQTKIAIFEKEDKLALHSSGRNSGVLHAGFYYTADSLKAKFTRDGNFAMKKFCVDNKLKINYSKKVVVAKNKEEDSTIYELYNRGIKNNVDVKIIDKNELKKIDNNVKTYDVSLYSPNTATVDPIEICKKLEFNLSKKGVIFFKNTPFIARKGSKSFLSSNGRLFYYEKLINCAGLYADKIAKQFGYSKRMSIVPFKGIYLKYNGKKPPVKVNVYPVPNLKNPFLGVHYTVTVNNEVKIGPTSIPAFWRENYTGFKNFKLNELIKILFVEGELFLKNSFGFRNLAIQEIKKYNRKHFVNLASSMVYNFDAQGFNKWIRPGIRAQLLDHDSNELVMDFVVQGDNETTHVLNAVSPAWTCSFPFADFIVNKYILNEK
jgi:L-2-hydroxyglutarate oxidase LhgO